MGLIPLRHKIALVAAMEEGLVGVGRTATNTRSAEDYFAHTTEELKKDERPQFSYQVGVTLVRSLYSSRLTLPRF